MKSYIASVKPSDIPDTIAICLTVVLECITFSRCSISQINDKYLSFCIVFLYENEMNSVFMTQKRMKTSDLYCIWFLLPTTSKKSQNCPVIVDLNALKILTSFHTRGLLILDRHGVW